MTPADKPDTPWRMTRGVVMASFRAGEEAGKPLQEPAHITPRYPNGIKNSDLGRVDKIIQRETALWWFLLNLVPYDLSRGGPYFGFADTTGASPVQAAAGQEAGGKDVVGEIPTIVGWDQGYWAPDALQASKVLRDEFGSALPDEAITELSIALPGNWMWKPPPISFPGGDAQALALAALVPVLAALTSELRKLTFPPAHGGMGHNSSGADIPLTEQELAEIIAELMEAQQAAETGQGDAPSKVTNIWQKISPKLTDLGLWALRVVGVVAAGTASDYIAEYLPPPHFLVHSLFLEADHLISLLSAL